MIEKNVDDDGYIENDEKLINILLNNIYGIDKNGDAIDVAIFSLYITLLDYKNPKTLKSFTLPKIKNTNLLVLDFFDDIVDEKLKNINFDFIVGNPPWGRTNGIHLDYCKRKNYFIQNNEIARSFMYRTKDFSSKDTKCILIVTSKILYNKQTPTTNFRKWLLENSKIEKVIELSPVRELIFKDAKCPAIIISYKFTSDVLNNAITHLTLLPNIFFKLFNIIMIERYNIKKIKQNYLIKYDWLWKTIVFGNSYDFETILYLQKNFKTLQEALKEKNIACMTGIQLSGNSKDASKFLNQKLINSRKGIGAFSLDLNYCENFKQEKVHRIRDEKIFNPPYVLLKKGFDIDTYKLRSVYTEEKLLYTDSITGIKGEIHQKETLLSIVGNLNSSLYSYLNLMLGSSSGIEREQSFISETLKFPFVNDQEIADQVLKIQEMKKLNPQNFVLADEVIEKEVKKLDELVLKKFNLQDNKFIDYALNIQLSKITNKEKEYRKVTKEELINYSLVFLNYFENIFKDEKICFQREFSYNVLDKYCEFKFYLVEDEGENTILFKDVSEKQFITLFMQKKFNDLFYQNNDIIDFGENYFRIIKFDEYKNWHQACALIDLDYVINEIFHGEGE